jgi:hypothetical protein
MRLFGKVAPTTQAMTVFGARFNCIMADFIQRRIAFFGRFEPNLTYFLLSVLKSGDIFAGVGSNIGHFTPLAERGRSRKGLRQRGGSGKRIDFCLPILRLSPTTSA